MGSETVWLGVDCGGADAVGGGGSGDTEGDFTSVGDEDVG